MQSCTPWVLSAVPYNNAHTAAYSLLPTILTDVAVSHTLTAYNITNTRTAANRMQSAKNATYAGSAARLGAELLNTCVDTSGGMASAAHALVRASGEEGERWSAGTRSAATVERQLLSVMAVAIQRGNELTVLSGYLRAARTRASGGGRREKQHGTGQEQEKNQDGEEEAEEREVDNEEAN